MAIFNVARFQGFSRLNGINFFHWRDNCNLIFENQVSSLLFPMKAALIKHARTIAIAGILLLFAGSFSHAFGQQAIAEEDLPKPVKISFAKSFPVIAGKWMLRDSLHYQVRFKADGQMRNYIYRKEGRLLIARVLMTFEDCPPAIKADVNAKYSGRVPDLAFKTKSAKGQYYEIMLVSTEKQELIRYSNDGTWISSRVVKDQDNLPIE